jgi:DNA-binding CsgD family transcriptional regulator
MSLAFSEANQKLNELNHQLTTTNNSLQESNLVKEEYITNFFDVCSAYVDKLESYRRVLNKHAKQDRMNEMLKLLDTDIIKQELGELYNKFDTIFLNLYPAFVDDFNAVRTENSKIVLKRGELMNTELRIFALIRLGITNSAKIASFLRYSISAIYNYRVRARKYCNVDKKTFEELVMNMGLGKEVIHL